MSKKRFKNTRRDISSERMFFEQKILSTHLLDRSDLLNLIRGGEDTYIELKVRLNSVEKITAEIIALANSGGGAIIFGVNDKCRVEGLDNVDEVEEQLLAICRNQILPPVFPRIDKVAFDNGKRIVVLEVGSRHAPHSTLDRRFYIRLGSNKQEASREEVMELYNNKRPAGFENLPLVEADLNNIDEAHLWSYVRALRGENFGQDNGYPTFQVMKDMGLAVDYSDKDGSDIVPTLGGLLLFGNYSQVGKIFPRATVIATRFSGNSVSDPVVERAELSGNLAVIFERALNFITRYADLWDSRPSRTQDLTAQPGDQFIVARADYNRAVVFEAITNALVHRDYSLRDGHTQLLIFDNRIEIINPCRTNGLSIESIKYGVVNAPNPRLKAIFKNPYYGVPVVAGGVPMMLREGKKFSGHSPEIRICNGEFRIKLDGI